MISPSTGSYTHRSVVCQSVTFGVGGGLGEGGLGEGGLGEAGGASSDGRDGPRPMMLLAVTTELGEGGTGEADGGGGDGRDGS